MFSKPPPPPHAERHPRALIDTQSFQSNPRYAKRNNDGSVPISAPTPKKSRSKQNERHQTHAKPASNPDNGVKPLTQHQKDNAKKRDIMNQHQADAHASRTLAESELLDIQKQVHVISEQLDQHPIGTLHEATMPSPNMFEKLAPPPGLDSNIRLACEGDASFIEKLESKHIIDQSCPCPTDENPDHMIPIRVETHAIFSTLVSNPDYHYAHNTVVHSAEVLFNTDGPPSIQIKTMNSSMTHQLSPEEGDGAMVTRVTAPHDRTSLHMTIHPNGFRFVQEYAHDGATIQLGLYGIEKPIPLRVDPELRHIMHQSIQTFVGIHRELVHTYNADPTRTPKAHFYHERLFSEPMKLSEPGAQVTFATIRMLANHREKGNAIVTIKCASDSNDSRANRTQANTRHLVNARFARCGQFATRA